MQTRSLHFIIARSWGCSLWIYNDADRTAYHLHEELPAGGEGRVWRASQIGRRGKPLPVAVKVLRRDSYLTLDLDPAEVLERWREQERILRSFMHEGFVPIQDVFRSSWRWRTPRALRGMPVVVIRWVDGVTLRRWTQECGDIGDRLEPLRICANGLDRFHAETDYIHRDLSPDNVLITMAGEGRIIDYGLLRDRTLARSGSTILGTRPYVAPEILLNHEYSVDTDVYAFAGLLYFALVGVDPPDGSLANRSTHMADTLRGAGFPQVAPVLAGYLHADPCLRSSSSSLENMFDTIVDFVRSQSDPSHRGRAGMSTGERRPTPRTMALTAVLGESATVELESPDDWPDHHRVVRYGFVTFAGILLLYFVVRVFLR